MSQADGQGPVVAPPPPFPFPPPGPVHTQAGPGPAPAPPVDSWAAWSNHVLAELRRGHDEREKLQRLILESNASQAKAHTEMKVEIATLKASAGRWGALGGAVAAVTAFMALVGSWLGLGLTGGGGGH